MSEFISIKYLIEVFAAFVGIFSITLGTYILFQKFKNKTARYLSILVFSSGFWILSVYFANISTNLEDLVFWTKSASIFGILYTLFFSIFASAFRKPSRHWKNYLWLSIPVLLNIFYILDFNKSEVYVSNPFDGFAYDGPIGGVLSAKFSIFLILFLIYYILGYVILWSGYKKLTTKTKNQIKYITIGASISIISAILFDIILPILGIDYLYALGPALSIALVGLTAYTIIKHQLLDIKVVIQKGLIYTLLLITFLGFYIILVSITGYIFQQITQSAVIVSAGITIIFGIFGYPYIEGFFRNITDKIFFKGKYDYKNTLHELSEILNTSIDFNSLRNNSSEILKKIMRTEKAYILKDGSNYIKDFSKEKYSLELPIKVQNEKLGSLIMGKKLSGDDYTQEDITLLKTFSHQAGMAIKRSELYEELKEYSKNLEKKVKERTRQIEKLQEEQKQIMLDISHNLQTPLTIMKSEIDLLRKDNCDSEKIASVEKSIDELSKFIYSLLRLSKFDSLDILDKDKEKVNLSKLLHELIEYFEILLKNNKIELFTDIPENIFVFGTKNELEELIINLVSNSVKYIGENGDRKIYISMYSKNNFVEILIKDTGIGISEEKLPNIFDRFYTNEKGNIKSSGLGLAISKKIVEKHSGTISVESEVNKGSTFTIKLPILK